MPKHARSVTPHDPLSWIDTDLPAQSSREQLKECSGLGMRTIDRALACGELVAVRIGRRVLIPRPAIRAWLEAGIR